VEDADEVMQRDLVKIKPDLPKAVALPYYVYTSQDIHELELRRIFYSKWLVACHISQLSKPGDVITVEIGDKSILVVRMDDGKLGAYYNVCRHRGTRLLNQSKNVTSIQCPYHAWTYKLDGSLIGCPDMDQYFSFKKEDHHLFRVKFELRGGFVWVNLDPDSQPLSSQLGDLAERFRKYRLEEMRWIGTIGVYEVDSNWKIIMENTNECYHCPTVHPETLRAYYRHLVPIDGSKISGNYSLLQWKDYVSSNRDVEPNQAESARMLGLEGEDKECLHLATSFPNCQLTISPSWCITIAAWPVGLRRSRVIMEMYGHQWPGSNHDYDEVMKWWDFVNKQDWPICELQQKGLESGVFVGAGFNALERAVYHFQRLYVDSMLSPEA
jgi:Rieske 2Fe-2S family protein